MKFTATTRNYIKSEINAKAEEAVKPLLARIDKINEENSGRLERVKVALGKAAVKWEAEAVALAAKLGLTARDDHSLVNFHVGCDDFAETWTAYRGYGDRSTFTHELNKELSALEQKVDRIRASVDREYGRIVATIELGDTSKSVTELIAGVRFE